ncbi:MAG: lipid-A-disaccharide synthase, partial [Melioribacteraceae bacterium]|nr:lipid-A-disaccharide synthase [Melioribacteraceae bacterium]
AHYNIQQMAFLGFAEVVKHLPFIKKVKKDLLNIVKKENIKNVILIDYPGFNLNIAKSFSELGLNIYYYISPQVWAWGKNRIHKIRALVKKMLVIFPFEENFYKDYNIDATYVGHPIVEHISNYKFLSKEELYDKFNLEKEKDILLLLPGSRIQEIEKHFKVSIQAAELISQKFKLQIVVACSENLDQNIFTKFENTAKYKFIKGHTYDLLKYSKFGIIKSGTSTLEAGYFQLPFIVIYVTNFITYFIGKFLAKIKNIAMANILLEETVIPELIQKEVTVKNIYNTVESFLNDNHKYILTKEKLNKIKERLGNQKASENAARIIYLAMNET